MCASRCLPGSPRYPVVPSIGSRGLSPLPRHHTKSASYVASEPLLHMTIAQGSRPGHGRIITYCSNIEKSVPALFSSQAATKSPTGSFLKICGSTTISRSGGSAIAGPARSTCTRWCRCRARSCGAGRTMRRPSTGSGSTGAPRGNCAMSRRRPRPARTGEAPAERKRDGVSGDVLVGRLVAMARACGRSAGGFRRCASSCGPATRHRDRRRRPARPRSATPVRR